MRESWNPYKRNQFKYNEEQVRSPWDLNAENPDSWLNNNNSPIATKGYTRQEAPDGGLAEYLEEERRAGRYSGEPMEGGSYPKTGYGAYGAYPVLESWNRPEDVPELSYEEYLKGEIAAGRYTEQKEEEDPWWKKGDPVPILAMNSDYGAYSLGQALGAPKGTKGRGMGIAAGIGDTALGLGRNLLSGIADSRDSGRVYRDSRLRQNYYDQGRYTRDRGQYTDPSTRVNKFGSLFQDPSRRGHFEEGGEQMSEEEMAMMQQMMQQGEGQPQEQGQEQPQQGAEQEVQEMAMQLVEQFQGDLDTIAQYLEQEGVDEQIINMVMQIATEMVQQQGEQQQEEPMPEAGGGSAVMRNTMNGRMDMPMEFRRGGQFPVLPR